MLSWSVVLMLDEERIFQAAVEVAAPREREELLRRLCGDNSRLRASVEALLRHHDAAGDFLETPPIRHDFPELRAGETQCAGGDDSVDMPRGLARAGQHAMFEPPARPGLLGRLDHYDIIDVHGSGGMAVVYRAYDPKLARQVAIKMLAPELAERPAAGERFLREARAMALVRHPHVVTIHGIEDRGPLPYLVMEFVQGITLQERIDAQQPFDLAETLRIGLQIAEGLSAAHALGLVHRDIKPANILLEGDSGQVKIADFGLALAARETGDEQAREIVGTPQYMPPEQARGGAPDQRGDLFCLGGVLYAMCTGRPAYSTVAALAALRGESAEDPPPIRTLNPAVPPWLAELIHRLLDTDPQRRPHSAAEVAANFRRRLAPTTPTGAVNVSPPLQLTSPAAPPDRWLRLAGLGAAGLLAVCAVIFILRSNGATTRIEVPDGATVQVADDGTVQVHLPRPDSGPPAPERPGSVEASSNPANGKSSRPEVTATSAAAWEQSVRPLPADSQVQAVAERLRQLNPGFDGQLQPTIDGAQVTGLQFVADNVTDLSPLRALTRLTSLDCDGNSSDLPAKLADLAALKDLRLERLSVSYTQVADLEPLRGMPLRSLNCAWTRISDLRPLMGMPLRDLSFQNSLVTDLAPLRGLPLDSLNISSTRVTDIAPLSGLPLSSLYMDDTSIADLSPLRTLRLHRLNWRGYDPHRAAYANVVQSIATLEDINGRPAAQFWSNPLLDAP